jgi:hypothetical protein
VTCLYDVGTNSVRSHSRHEDTATNCLRCRIATDAGIQMGVGCWWRVARVEIYICKVFGSFHFIEGIPPNYCCTMMNGVVDSHMETCTLPTLAFSGRCLSSILEIVL